MNNPNTGLVMKYFVLKPGGDTPYSKASREAILSYADSIEPENPSLAVELREWAWNCEKELVDA